MSTYALLHEHIRKTIVLSGLTSCHIHTAAGQTEVRKDRSLGWKENLYNILDMFDLGF